MEINNITTEKNIIQKKAKNSTWTKVLPIMFIMCAITNLWHNGARVNEIHVIILVALAIYARNIIRDKVIVSQTKNILYTIFTMFFVIATSCSLAGLKFF